MISSIGAVSLSQQQYSISENGGSFTGIILSSSLGILDSIMVEVTISDGSANGNI